MKIVKILGGLGNQMFQYAFYLALKEKYPNEEIKIDTSCFRGYHLHNGYELAKIFGIKATEATFMDKFKIAYPYFHYRSWQIFKRILPQRKTMFAEKSNEEFDKRVFAQNQNCYYDGYWQNELYFKNLKDEIQKVFTAKNISKKNQEYATMLQGSESVSIHIRRGDYLTNPLYKGICIEKYYQKSIAYIQSQKQIECYCIFSNDINWCKVHLNNLLLAKNIIFVDWNKGKDSYQDLYLMSCCKHNIIANSSFSWWGAWLNHNNKKMVICPKKWNNIKNSKFELPSDWVKL